QRSARSTPKPMIRRVNTSFTTMTQWLRKSSDSQRNKSTLHRLSLRCPIKLSQDGPSVPAPGRECCASTRRTISLSISMPKARAISWAMRGQPIRGLRRLSGRRRRAKEFWGLGCAVAAAVYRFRRYVQAVSKRADLRLGDMRTYLTFGVGGTRRAAGRVLTLPAQATFPGRGLGAEVSQGGRPHVLAAYIQFALS